MKVVVDLVGVTQHWDADTNENTNIAQLVVGGVEVNIPVDETQLKALIASTQTSAYEGPAVEPEYQNEYFSDPSNPQWTADELPTNDDGERVFGGDVEASAPALFEAPLNTDSLEAPEPEPRAIPKSSTQQRLEAIQASQAHRPSAVRKADKAALRARAKKVPHGRIAQDDMGYPVVARKADKKLTHAAPEIRQVDVHSSTEEAPDEFFGQG